MKALHGRPATTLIRATASALALVAGCATTEKMTAEQATAQCQTEGFKPRTDEYLYCALRKADPKNAEWKIAELEKLRVQREGWEAQCNAIFDPPDVIADKRGLNLVLARDACVRDKAEANGLLRQAAGGTTSTTVVAPLPRVEAPRQPICLVMKDGVCTQFGTTR